MQTHYIRVGQSDDRTSIHKRVDERGVKLLSEDELENALFFASLGSVDEAKLKFLRREHVRRLNEMGDEEGLKKLLWTILQDEVAALFTNTDLFDIPHTVLTAYDSDGHGVEITGLQVHKSFFE